MFWQIETLGIAIPRYLAEVERLLHLGTHSVIPWNQNALSLGGKIFSAHLLNGFGLATVDIVRFLEGVRTGVNYSWEPAAPDPAGNVAVDTAADEDPSQQPLPTFRPMSIVAKRSPISATAELLLCLSQFVFLLSTLNTHYRQHCAQRKPAGISFTQRPILRFFAPQG